MNKWTNEEIEQMMMYVEACDDETMEELYEYVHHMMYKEGNHPDFKERTLSAITAKIRKLCRNGFRKSCKI